MTSLIQEQSRVPVITDNRPDRLRRSVEIINLHQRSVVVECSCWSTHGAYYNTELVFASFSVRSLVNKVDDLVEVRRDESVDVLFPVETRHDADSVCVPRLRSEGFQVADRPRPRPPFAPASMAVNHGGVVVAASPVKLSPLDLGLLPT